MYYLYSILYLLLVQTKATPAGGNAVSTTGEAATTSGATGAAPTAAPSFFESMITFLPMMLAMMLVYLFLMRPKPGANASSGKVPELKKNDRVVTAGGIVGTVVKNDAESEMTTLRVDDSGNTRMQFLTSSIVKVLSDEKDSNKSSSDKK